MKINIIVVDAISGRPVPEARISLALEDRDHGADTNEFGKWEWFRPDEVQYTEKAYVCKVSKKGYQTWTISETFQENELALEVQLVPESINMSFIVKDDAKIPVSAATITFEVGSDTQDAYSTDAQGALVIPISKDHAGKVFKYRVEKESYVPVVNQLEIKEDAPNIIEIELSKSHFQISFQVKNESGAPVAGSKIAIEYIGQLVKQEVSNESGQASFTLHSEYKGKTITVLVEKEKYQSSRQDIVLGEGTSFSVSLNREEEVAPINYLQSWKKVSYFLVPWLVISPWILSILLNISKSFNKEIVTIAIGNMYLVALVTTVLAIIRPIKPKVALKWVIGVQGISFFLAFLFDTSSDRIGFVIVFGLGVLLNVCVVAVLCWWRRKKSQAKS